MSNRELVVLGTASQQPTRLRNHSGYVLLWDDEAILVDPGEGTQRQLLISGVRPTRITRICITHLHGDHCLGLPGIVALLSQLPMPGPVSLHFPASGAHQIERLLDSSIVDNDADLRLDPVTAPAVVVDRPGFRLRAEPLQHSADSVGWRVEAPAGTHLRPDRLRELGIAGSDVGHLAAPARCAWTSPVVSPLATKEITIVSTPRQTAGALGDRLGLEGARPVPGHTISTGPTSVNTVLVRVPLRELPVPSPSAACFS